MHSKLNLSAMVCVLALLCAAVIAAPAQGIFFSTLASFNGTNGALPAYVTLVHSGDGNFYGTTSRGGAAGACTDDLGCGTVFRVTPGGSVTRLYSFCSRPSCADGSWPQAGLVQGSDGNFYGTTYKGGGVACGDSSGCGTVFKVTPTGAMTTLYSFCSQTNCTDGTYPFGGLVQGSDGNFYGTTQVYGAHNHGTVFKITTAGMLSTLYSFCSLPICADGNLPEAPLVQATDGNFYGTTLGGGAYNGGIVFKITPAGALSTLYSFCSQPNCADGNSPDAALLQGSDGNFYGTTNGGGANGGYGTVFKLTPAGALTTVHSFCSQPNCADGAILDAPLVQDSDGNFYGTTSLDGAYNYGTVFKITPAGTLTTLHSFDATDGAQSLGGLVQAFDGSFYGVTYVGGDLHYCFGMGCGTVFRIGVVRACATCRP